ncbi:MAG: hypothetical protein COW89_02240 [Nitrospinae bacterium CG22_combo_CG10-13_8_21_14_all_47_10]|nr:MAG: hypothetical protein COW89_02240 [Nitrospinae bacterium CG22_combo_CG10-13_8_21_14_all_47_10]
MKSPKPNPDNRCPREFDTLGDHLRKCRLDFGLLQKDLARLLGVDKTTIANWENDRFSPVSGSFLWSRSYLAIAPGPGDIGGDPSLVGGLEDHFLLHGN